MASPCFSSIFLLLSIFLLALIQFALCGNFYEDVDNLFGDVRVDIKDKGQSMTLTMDEYSGSGIVSKNEYLFGRFDLKIKLFLGNLTGDPYLLSTNVYADVVGGREMQYYLWFDPTEDFHTYSIDWNPDRIMQTIGVPFPTTQPMRLYTTLWNEDSWATRWGVVNLDLSDAPFVAASIKTRWGPHFITDIKGRFCSSVSFKHFNANACIAKEGGASCKGFNRSIFRDLVEFCFFCFSVSFYVIC
ncbi:putative xyloglucan endotransglucosylase/hydrolase protein 23 [Glycine max]|nr:putative xyloglucan endotransglucosylase/hydrolase protein 23 [Glycine max]